MDDMKGAYLELTPQLDGLDILPEAERENLEIKCLRTALNPDFPLGSKHFTHSGTQKKVNKPSLCFTLKTIRKITVALNGN